MPRRRSNIGCSSYFTVKIYMLTAFFKLCSEDDFARTLAYDKVPGGTTWNQVTKQETVVEGYPDVWKNNRPLQSLRSPC